jgi:hypothetical protein
LVHVDPYDPDAREPGSMSALELTARMIDAGIGVMYWYGFDVPADRAWALRALYEATGAALWLGDAFARAYEGAPLPGGGDGALDFQVTVSARA